MGPPIAQARVVGSLLQDRRTRSAHGTKKLTLSFGQALRHLNSARSGGKQGGPVSSLRGQEPVQFPSFGWRHGGLARISQCVQGGGDGTSVACKRTESPFVQGKFEMQERPIRVLVAAPPCPGITRLTECLRLQGFAVDTTHSLPVAFARLDSNPYDAVVVHRFLDPSQGFGATAALRFAGERQDGVVLAMLSGCTEEAGRRCARGRLRVHVVQRAYEGRRSCEWVADQIRAAVCQVRQGKVGVSREARSGR